MMIVSGTKDIEFFLVKSGSTLATQLSTNYNKYVKHN